MKDMNRLEGKKEPKEKKPRPKVKKFDPLEPLKMEIAAELGLLGQIQTSGWDSLTAQDAGRIGGLIAHRKRKQDKNG